MSKNSKDKKDGYTVPYQKLTLLPVIWLPFYFFIVGPMLSGPRSSTIGLNVTVATITAITGFIGECILLSRGVKGSQRIYAILGIFFSFILLFYAYIVYGFSMGPNRFTF